MVPESMIDVLVSWRDNHLKVEMDSNSDVKELGLKLVTLTNVKPETMKLLIPLSTSKGSKLLIPFSAEHSSLPLQEVSNLEGKPIRMLGSFENEIQAVSQNDSKLDSRIIGFDEEEKRLRQRLIDTPHSSLKLPHGAYIFCNFRTLHIPGIELNPPASEALKRMHMLACDPGIISLMNKHRWRVGIMTEMAPVGYVGISPKCLLGFNKNHGEEISLRLRTDDLKGFRKYESIKKTLLHELAHMVYSEHDANFYALDKQLNEEANTLDWTKSKSHTLSGTKISNHYGDEVNVQTSYHSIGKKLGGANLMSLNSARASSVNAAYNRYILSSMSSTEETKTFLRNINEDVRHVMEDHVSSTTSKPVPDNSISKDEPDPDDGVFKNEPDPDDGVFKNEPDPDDSMVLDPDDSIMTMEPDPDESVREPDDSLNLRSWNVEPGHNDSLPTVDDMLVDRPMVAVKNSVSTSSQKETPDGGCCRQSVSRRTDSFGKPDLDDSLAGENTFSGGFPDPNEKISGKISVNHEKIKEQLPDASGSLQIKLQQMHTFPERGHKEPDPDDSISDGIQDGQSMKSEPDVKSNMTVKEKDELERIEEPVVVICQRLQKAIESLRSESTQAETAASLQTLFKIIKNVIEHPDDMKFGRLRKDNRLFQKTVANHKAAMEILTVIGFCEDILTDDIGRLETYMVLKRNDPGLLWLAKSSLELALG